MLDAAKYIGQDVVYATSDNTIRSTKCESIEYHEGLRKWQLICTSPNGHRLSLSLDEIFVNKEDVK